jgi:flagellar basal body-associated protein FliL
MHKEKGNALISIIIIVLVLIAGGVSFWSMTSKRIAENKAARSAAESQSASVISAQ